MEPHGVNPGWCAGSGKGKGSDMTSPHPPRVSVRRWFALVTLCVLGLGLFVVAVPPAVAQEAALAQSEADERQGQPGPAGSNGMWCRAVADQADRDSRVIVQDGGNTDVVLHHCSAVDGLPATGTGPGGTIAPSKDDGLPVGAVAAIVAGVLAAPLVVSALIKGRNRRRVTDTVTEDATSGPIVTSSGKVWMRFK